MSKAPVLVFAILCDEVIIEKGKYTFRGLFDQIGVPNYPAVHRSAFIVTRWGMGTGDGYKQSIIVKIRNTGKIIFDSTALENEFSLSGLTYSHIIVGNMMDLIFTDDCECVVEIYLNGVKQEVELFFKVVKTS